MIITETRHKLLIFMVEKGMTQKELAHQLDYNYEHLNAVLAGRYAISQRLHTAIENLFKRFNYDKALDDKKRL